MEVVKVDNLVKRYKEKVALDHLSFSVEEGEIFGLLGPNGSGKTTAINCILSLLSYDMGTVEVLGKEMTPKSYDIKREIGIVMQDVGVFYQLTVYENIDYFCGLYISDKAQRKEMIKEAIHFTGLEGYEKYKPAKLSGGLLRRLNIACGIAHRPKLIFMDEPTVAVDPQSRNKILEGIKELNKNGATIIYTSHYMEEVELICSQIAIIDNGKKIAGGTCEQLKSLINTGEKITIDVKEISEEQIKKLKEVPHVFNVSYENEQLKVRCNSGKHNLIRILDFMKNNEILFGRVYSELPTLNDVFLEITGKELRD